MHSIRGAHTCYMKNGTHRCADRTHCPRISMLRSLGYNSNISDASTFTFALGLASEKVFQTEYPQAKVDVPVVIELTPQVKFVGHADGIYEDCVYELKSVSSSSRAVETVVHREYKEGNLLQLVGYMLAAEKVKGMLRYTNFVWHKCTVNKIPRKIVPCNVDFAVIINDDGEIEVDGRPTGITVMMVLDSLTDIAKHLVAGTVPERPEDYRKEFDGPCSFCELRDVCEITNELPIFLQGVENTGKFNKESV